MPRRGSLKSWPDQRNTRPQAAHSQTASQSVRSPASCSWANTRLLSNGPDGPKTRSLNGPASRRQPEPRCRLMRSLPGGPPSTPSAPPNIATRRQTRVRPRVERSPQSTARVKGDDGDGFSRRSLIVVVRRGGASSELEKPVASLTHQLFGVKRPAKAAPRQRDFRVRF